MFEEACLIQPIDQQASITLGCQNGKQHLVGSFKVSQNSETLKMLSLLA